MSPEAVEICQRQILLSMRDAGKHFAQTWNTMCEPFMKAGSLNSTRFARHAHEVAEQELQRRAKIVWELVRDVLDNEGFAPSEDNRNQVRSLLLDAVGTQSTDVQKILESRTNGLLAPELQSLEQGRLHALDSALGAFDIDVLGRTKRRPPLLDELSPPRYAPVKAHWCNALELAGKDIPDLPNALKEAASGVESLAQIVLGKPGVTLGEAVKQLRSKGTIPAGADSVLEGLWTFASSSPGARHGSSLPAHVNPNHWEFAKTTAEASLRLLLDLDAK